MVEMGLRMKKQLLPSAIPMIQALLEANDSEVKKETHTVGRRRGFGSGRSRPHSQTTEEKLSSSKVRGHESK